MGGLLALERAKAAPERVAALALLSAPLRLRRTQVSGIRLLSLVPQRLRRGRLRAIPKSLGSDVAHPDLRGKIQGLPAMPVRALENLLELMAAARVDLGRVLAPTLVAHGRHDHTVPIAASVELSRLLGARTVERLWLENSFHLRASDGQLRLSVSCASWRPTPAGRMARCALMPITCWPSIKGRRVRPCSSSTRRWRFGGVATRRSLRSIRIPERSSTILR